VRRAEIPKSALQNATEMAKVSHDDLWSEPKMFASVYDEIVSTDRKNNLDRPDTEFEDWLELGAKLGGADVRH